VGKDILGRLLFDVPYTLRHTIEEEMDRGVDDDDEDNYESSDKDEDEDETLIDMDSTNISSEVEMVSFLKHHNDNRNSPSSSSSSSSSVDKANDRVPKLSKEGQTKAHHPPSAAYVCNTSLNILLLTLVTLFLFTISSSAGGHYIDQQTTTNSSSSPISLLSKVGDIAAPTFPLLLFTYLTLRTILPWTRTKRYLWTVLAYTVGAPAYEVTFRDGFVGDILTSTVRPMQDLAYTVFYLTMGLQGWWTVRTTNINNNNDDDTSFGNEVPIERSWLLHTVLLPALTLSPLWWRFCQTLRQTYVTKNRWPYLGNAAKYFIAAQVAVFVVYEPERRGELGWRVCAVLGTLYQIWWDVFMDWELLEVELENGGNSGGGEVGSTDKWWYPSIRMRLRRNRLYQSRVTYVGIAILNVVLRFGWTLTFVPDRYLSPKSGMLLQNFTTGGNGTLREMIGPALAAAEIVRRTLWGLLRLELEALKVVEKLRNEEEQEEKRHAIENGENIGLMDVSMLEMEGDDVVLEPMAIGSSGGKSSSSLMETVVLWNDMSASSDVHVMWELCFYATVFTGMGMIAAVHRQVY